MIRRFAVGVSLLALPVLLLATYLTVRHLVYWSPSENFTFTSGDIELAGTLVKPAREAKFPAILMLHGSGPEPTGDPPSRAVVNTLVRSGFAAAYYDKRGVGGSGGDFDSATLRDFLNDATAAVYYLAGRADIDADRIGLYVVSESGWFAPELAVSTGHIAFIFHKVAPPLSRADTVRWEWRNDYLAAGVPESAVDTLVDFAGERTAYYVAAAADPSLASGERRSALERELGRLRNEVPQAGEVLPEHIWAYDKTAYERYAMDASYDPTPFLARLEIPLYYTFGARDINIPTRQSVAALEALRRQGKDIEITVYPGVGHSLASWNGLMNVGFPAGYLETLSRWTRAQVNID